MKVLKIIEKHNHNNSNNIHKQKQIKTYINSKT